MKLTFEYNENMGTAKGKEEVHLIAEVDDGFLEEAEAYVPVLGRFINVTPQVRATEYVMSIIRGDIHSINWQEKEDSEER